MKNTKPTLSNETGVGDSRKFIHASKRIRKGDKVIAIAGNDRGQIGTVLNVLGPKVVVQGLNVRKKHVKKSQANPQGGIIELEKPIHVSNVKLVGNDDKPVKLRVNVRHDDQKTRQLVYQSGGEEVVHRTIKKS